MPTAPRAGDSGYRPPPIPTRSSSSASRGGTACSASCTATRRESLSATCTSRTTYRRSRSTWTLRPVRRGAAPPVLQSRAGVRTAAARPESRRRLVPFHAGAGAQVDVHPHGAANRRHLFHVPHRFARLQRDLVRHREEFLDLRTGLACLPWTRILTTRGQQ